MTAPTTALPPTVLTARRGGNNVVLPTRFAIFGSCDRADMALWVTDHRNHNALWFDTAYGRVQLIDATLTCVDEDGNLWQATGRIVPGDSYLDGDSDIFAFVRFDVSRQKGQCGSAEIQLEPYVMLPI